MHAEHERAVRLALERPLLGAVGGLGSAVDEVDQHQVLVELRRHLREPPLSVEHERGTVEDQLVLPADQVCIDERQPGA